MIVEQTVTIRIDLGDANLVDADGFDDTIGAAHAWLTAHMPGAEVGCLDWSQGETISEDE